MGIAKRLSVLVAFAALFSALPVRAQSDMRSAIRAQLQADPNSASISEAEMSMLVESLAQKAEAQGVSPYAVATTTPQRKEQQVSPFVTAAGWLILAMAALAVISILYWILRKLRAATA